MTALGINYTSQCNLTGLQLAHLEKLNRLEEAGIAAYPYAFEVTHAPDEVRDQFGQLYETAQLISVASRIMAMRSSGKNLVFLDLAATSQQIRDNHHIQVMIHQGEVGAESWVIVENVSLGDWIGVEGVCMVTRSGEPTLRAQSLRMLSKTLRSIPLPKIYESSVDGSSAEAHTIQDLELLWRQPEIDMLTRRKANVLVARSQILRSVRNTLADQYKCVEIETPFLNRFFGGAEAAPFSTYVNALSEEVFLAISPEIELKRAVVGGIGAGGELGHGAYFIARNFRNEGVDRTHNPEFTSVEVYIPFVDFNFMLEVTERIYANACAAVHGTTACSFNGHLLDFGRQWPRYSMTELVRDMSGIDVENLNVQEVRAAIYDRGLHISHYLDGLEYADNAIKSQDLAQLLQRVGLAHLYSGFETLPQDDIRNLALRHKLHKGIDLDQELDFLILDLFDIYCEPLLIEPCHVILHPAKSTILCKEYRVGPLPNGLRLIERFESYAAGMELSNAYTELNDPRVQRRLVEEQAKLRASGRHEAMPHNELFLQSIELGLPPCGGLGIGIDRMVMLLTDSQAIRNVIAFPMTGDPG